MSVGNVVAPRPRAQHLGPERRTPHVLDTALAIAAERGVTAVSIATVAERMGVTRPVVYACFTNRREMLTALIEREEQYLLTGVLAALPTDATVDDPETTVVRGFQALLTTVAARPDSWRIVFAAEPDHAVADRFGGARAIVAQRAEELMTQWLRRHHPADLERKLPVLVELFMSASEGAVRALLHDGATWTPDELGELVGRTVYRGFHSLTAQEEEEG